MKLAPLAVLALFAAGLSPAQASDLVPAAPVFKLPSIFSQPETSAKNAPPISWQGAHVGVNFGHGWGNVDTTGNTMTTTGPLVGLPNNWFPSTTFTGANGNDDFQGILGGGQIGYDWQVNNIVFGIEGDYQGADINRSDWFLGSANGPLYVKSAGIDQFATIRGRLGYAFDNVLVYGTGGAAFGKLDSGLTIQPGTFAAPIGAPFSASNSTWKTGWTAGAGVEVAMSRNWSARMEYLHLDFDRAGVDFDFGNAGSAHSNGKITSDIVRAGLNYRF